MKIDQYKKYMNVKNDQHKKAEIHITWIYK